MQSNIPYLAIYTAAYTGACLGFALEASLETIRHTFASEPAPEGCDFIKVKEEIPDIFEKINHLRDDILFYFSETANDYARAFGNHCGPIPFAVVAKETAEMLDKDALHWIYKHEIAHIYYNDSFNASLVVAIATIATAYVLYRLQFMVPWWISTPLLCLPALVDVCIRYIFWCYAERRADDFAIEHATDEELMGGRCYFQGITEGSREIANMRIYPEIEKIDRSTKGWLIDIELDPHPSRIERIEKIEREMHKRKINVEALDNDDDYLQAKQKSIQCKLKMYAKWWRPKLEKSGLDPSKLDAEFDEVIEKFSRPCKA